MAVNIRELFPLRQAKAQRLQMPRYLKLDGGRYLIAAVMVLSLMSMLTLGQTGRLASKGYTISQLQNQQTLLLRQHSSLQMDLSEHQSLDSITQRAQDMGMRPVAPEQIRYVTIESDRANTLPNTNSTEQAVGIDTLPASTLEDPRLSVDE
ncbi:MAG: hypothetical protein GFH27_549279n228 [Chloroflexi bacterium AL-W]|nr:hypothetical protein [Chloroflexi bacterium AL-N1]NOK65194.1 hypothetical protein [Chloroflexi bacterium AL-N10]NOK72540.1 hypothetical protein [Chloroflexi bacterium AL-N5]NOK79373.1 hypothetical protein [Chloroflexi bacterium AL-W]NOK87289.1 hypothetical protein [Chloroflexi bacterium AL-N15]